MNMQAPSLQSSDTTVLGQAVLVYPGERPAIVMTGQVRWFGV